MLSFILQSNKTTQVKNLRRKGDVENMKISLEGNEVLACRENC